MEPKDIAGESPLNEGHGDFIILYLDPAQFGVDVFYFDSIGNKGPASDLLKNSGPWIVKFAIIFQ